jgi:hypothetical protein
MGLGQRFRIRRPEEVIEPLATAFLPPAEAKLRELSK